MSFDWDPIREALVGTFEERVGEKDFDKHLVKQCTTGYGQKYALYPRPNGNGLCELMMVTANARNTQVISPVMKISLEIPRGAARILLDNTEKHFSCNPLPDFTRPPVQCTIPTDYEQLSLTELDSDVHINPDRMLLPGDELFVRYSINGVGFHHAGIYGGSGRVYHFSTPQINDSTSLLRALQSDLSLPAQVKCESLLDFVNAMGAHASRPSLYRVTHPLLVREGRVICATAKRLLEENTFNSYSIKFKNSQHFSSCCSYGVEFSYDADRLFFNANALLPNGMIEKIIGASDHNESRNDAHVKPSHGFVKSEYVRSYEMPDSDYFAL